MIEKPLALIALCLSAACAAPQAGTTNPELQDTADRMAPMAPVTPVAPMPALDGEGVFFVATSEAARPKVRYLDGQVSLNRSCAIRLGNKLNRRIPPMYVNGKPIGFC